MWETLVGALALGFIALVILYIAVELGHGGGKPNHPDHNRNDAGRWET